MPNQRAAEKAAQYGYRILAVRPLSEKEFRLKLTRKGFSADVTETVATRFKELGYLNDETLARQLARSFALNKLWGDRRINISLKEKGLPRELIEEALAQARGEITERAALLKLLEKKDRAPGTGIEKDKEKRRIMQSLMGKGFPPGLIFELLAIKGEEEAHDGE